jgi:hypothetical protein
VACPYPKQTLGRALLPVLQSSMDHLGLRDHRSFPALRGAPTFHSVQLLSSLAAAIGLIWALGIAILAEASWFNLLPAAMQHSGATLLSSFSRHSV